MKNIAIVGGGKIGSTFAYQFAKAGHEVTVIARAGSLRLQQLQRDSGIVNDKGEREAVLVADTLDAGVAYDLVLVTLLAHQVDAVLPSLRMCAAKCIQFMFNTFEPERLGEVVGNSRCAFGMPFVQANFDKDGKLRCTIGTGGQKSKMNRQESVDLFNAAGLPAVFEADMLLWLRCHVPLCVAFESISYAGVRRGGGASWAEAMAVARGMQESFTLIRRLGYPLYPSGKKLLSNSPVAGPAAMLWGMSRIRSFRELLATGFGECRALVDVLVASAPKARPPVSSSAIEMLKCL